MACETQQAGALVSLFLQGVSVSYGSRKVLQQVSLHARAGQVLGIVGANGCGKTTLLKAIAGHLPCQGQIRFGDQLDVGHAVAYMPQDIQAPVALSVVEVVLLGRLKRLNLRVQAQDLDAVGNVLRRLGVEHLAARAMTELSGGQRQLVFLAQALVAEPALLLLDEPISALDICHQLEVLDLIQTMTRERHLCTVMVLHDLNAAARFADEVALLLDGKAITQGAPSDVLTIDNLAAAFGVRMEAMVSPKGRPVWIPDCKISLA